MSDIKKVAITGGGGYVGSMLVPYLLDRGYEVTVLDLFWYGRDVLGEVPDGAPLRLVEGDLRDPAALEEAFSGADAIIHLACISNDPSFELDPDLGRSINLEAFPGVVEAALEARAKRLIYASSSSVYGVREEPDVHEDTPCTPLTDYSKFKLECEDILRRTWRGDGSYVVIRPATVCGWAPRLRLDLTVNILTAHALENRLIRVFGGSQLRPNIHIKDMVEAYRVLLEAPREKVHGRVFNAGYHNMAVRDIADLVRDTLGDPEIQIQVEPTDDLRSYHISSDRIRRELGFEARHGLEEAVRDLAEAWKAGKVHDPLTNPRYYNIRTMKALTGAPS